MSLKPEDLDIRVSKYWKFVGWVTTTVIFISRKRPKYILYLDTGLDSESWGLFDSDHPFQFAALTEHTNKRRREVRITVERALAFLRLDEPSPETLFEVD